MIISDWKEVFETHLTDTYSVFHSLFRFVLFWPSYMSLFPVFFSGKALKLNHTSCQTADRQSELVNIIEYLAAKHATISDQKQNCK